MPVFGRQARPERIRERLEKIREKYPELYDALEKRPDEVVWLTHETLLHEKKEEHQHGVTATHLERVLRERWLGDFDAKNFAGALYEQSKHQGSAYLLANILSAGQWMFLQTYQARQQLLSSLHKHARQGYDAHPLAQMVATSRQVQMMLNKEPYLAEPLRLAFAEVQKKGGNVYDFASRVQNSAHYLENHRLKTILEEVTKHGREGGNPHAFFVFLSGQPEEGFDDRLGRVRTARKELAKASQFLHGLNTTQEYGKVGNNLFHQVLSTYKTKLPTMGEKKYWQWIGLSAKQFKANIGKTK